MNKGGYLLFIFLNRNRKIRIGKLGIISFKKGHYCYVGSALNNLDKRVSRHKSSDKKIHWHIDYLLQFAEIIRVRKIKTDKRVECAEARKLAKTYEPVKGFGCSDCSCKSHLFYLAKKLI